MHDSGGLLGDGTCQRPLERPRRRQPQPREDRERRGDEHDREVRELLERVVDDPRVLGRPVERGVLQRRRQRVRHDGPVGRHDAQPLAGREEQHDIAQPDQHPQGIEPEVEPEEDAHAARLTIRARPAGVVARPEAGRPLLRAELVSGAHDEQQEERVQEVLPAEPRRYADGRALGRRHDARVRLDERLHGGHPAEPARHEHDDDDRDDGDDRAPQHSLALSPPPVGGTSGSGRDHGHLEGTVPSPARAGAPATIECGRTTAAAVNCGCLDDSVGGRVREARTQHATTHRHGPSDSQGAGLLLRPRGRSGSRSKGVTVSDKSPKKSSSKTAASKTLKEKRADKKAKVAHRAGNDVSDVTHRK